jgi:ABC-type uncharacterized transport system permease subunit
MLHLLIGLILSTARISLPLTLAALGGFWSEKSGTPQVGLEGFLLLGALVGATFANLFNWLMPAFAVTLVTGALAGALFFLFSERLKLNAILVGLVFNLFVGGCAPFVTKLVFGSTGATPFLPPAIKWHLFPYFWVAFVLLAGGWVYRFTGFGLLVRFAGEKPAAISSAGFSVNKVRLFGLMICGAITASGGFLLSSFLASSYSPMMSAGRGFIALAALIFARWRWTQTFLIAILFGFMESLQIYLQGFDLPLPTQFFQTLPYLATLLLLLLGRKRPLAI